MQKKLFNNLPKRKKQDKGNPYENQRIMHCIQCILELLPRYLDNWSYVSKFSGKDNTSSRDYTQMSIFGSIEVKGTVPMVAAQLEF